MQTPFDRSIFVAFCRHPEIIAGGIILVAAATILGAWAFQVVGGYIPCELCYQERIPYYVGIPLAIVALASAHYGGPVWLTRGTLLLIGLSFAWGTYLAGYHTGVEWHFWPGPTDCAGDTATAVSTGDLLNQIGNIRVARCDVVQWTMFGLSFAGWNTVISAGLTVAGLFGAFFALVRAPATPRTA
jgi:disulfide bond formation protein DsbB